ncbi:hypothetical protein M8009_03445 [Halomonas sp. ATCH28]|uniref:Uncharacterized protein n=1 Tax=Halomonas gemina TaxID=2945105 RepID=A0ABT0SXG6_9GAMM|nr:hypothetical protein [Halomonas gemina]MCL7939358.1 hypothetical protein [Halomonas gemina]
MIERLPQHSQILIRLATHTRLNRHDLFLYLSKHSSGATIAPGGVGSIGRVAARVGTGVLTVFGAPVWDDRQILFSPMVHG